jgi:hypothetical protein
MSTAPQRGHQVSSSSTGATVNGVSGTSNAGLKRRWHEWEAGEHNPDDGKGFYAPIIARTFGTARYAIFPRAARRDGDSELLVATGMDTLDILARVQMSDVDATTLEALRLTRSCVGCDERTPS